MSKLTVVIAMRNTLMAMGVKHILENTFEVVAHCPSANELSHALVVDPDYIVVDDATFATSPSLLYPFKQRLIVVGSAESDELNTVDCSDPESSIIDRFNDIIERDSDARKNEPQQVLSAREVEVLTLVAQGLLNKQIADRLSISINTVLTHRKNITAKLGIKSVAGLSVYAMMNGMIKS